jgi:hypothetical protein
VSDRGATSWTQDVRQSLTNGVRPRMWSHASLEYAKHRFRGVRVRHYSLIYGLTLERREFVVVIRESYSLRPTLPTASSSIAGSNTRRFCSSLPSPSLVELLAGKSSEPACSDVFRLGFVNLVPFLYYRSRNMMPAASYLKNGSRVRCIGVNCSRTQSLRYAVTMRNGVTSTQHRHEEPGQQAS